MLNKEVSNSFKEKALAFSNMMKKVPYSVLSDRVVMAGGISEDKLIGFEVVPEGDHFIVRQLDGEVIDSSDTLRGALIKSVDQTYFMLARSLQELTDKEADLFNSSLANQLYSIR